MAGRVAILTGPPGSGKSTVARRLAETAPAHAVHLEGDYFWEFIKAGFLAPHLPESQKQNELVMDIAARNAADYAVAGYRVFYDGVVGPWFLPPFLSICRERNLALSYIILRPSLAVTMERARERAADKLKDSVPIRSLHAQLSGLGAYEQHVIDNSALSLNDTIARVHHALNDLRFTLPTD